MAYVNVAEWKPDQVTEWLKGLDNSIAPYLPLFLANHFNGQLLLNVRSEDLDNLGIKRLGHQELILEAVEHLRNFHYELDRENLQLLALRLSCQAHSLHNELRQLTDSQPVSTQTLADVASVVRAVKPLVCWLDRSPFSGQLEYADRKSDLLKCSLEIATCAQRDRFAERPVEEIRTSCGKLANIADGIIQDIADPLILQPASLDLATLRKRGGDDLGFFIVPSFHGIHQIGEIKFGSPAHQCGKVEEGDEVVQVNYQTVVGWQRKKVMALFEESSTEVFLTLKKRPRHTKVYGQIYMKPYRLPSKKRAPAYTRWHDNLPSPRPELLTIPDFEILVSRPAPKTPPSKHIPLEPSIIISSSSESDDAGSGCDEAIDYELEGHTSPTSMRLYLPKPRVPVQRRATITGSSPTAHLPPVDLEKFWKELKLEKKWKYSGKTPDSHNSNPECRVLRNKSPCEQNERPSTCLGFEKSSSKDFIKQVDYVVKHVKTSEGITCLSECDKKPFDLNVHSNSRNDICLPTSVLEGETFSSENSKEPKNEKRFVTRLELTVDPRDCQIQIAEVSGKDVETKGLISGEKEPRTPDSLTTEDTCPSFIQKTRKISTESEVGELPIHRERGRLDKSFSTPAYDLSGLEGLEVNQKSPGPIGETESADKFGSISIRSNNESCSDYSAMPDLTSSSTTVIRRPQDHSTPTVFQFPPTIKPASFSSVKGRDKEEIPRGDNCDMNSNPVLHGRVVETINRHLLDSNCGKDGDEDCDDMRDNHRMNAGFSRTITNVLNSPDLISDINTHRLYPKPDDDFDNGNHFQFSLSPRLDNSESSFDSNRNSPHTKLSFHLASQSKPTTPTSPYIEHSFKETDSYHVSSPMDAASPNLFKGEVRKPPPNPPSRHHSSSDMPDHSSQSSGQPKIPVKISVSPPEPPPRPTPPNRSPSVPLDQHKSVFRTIMSTKTSGPKTVFGSPKVLRKKNTLLAKRRSVSVKELGIGDYQGWLYRRLRIGDSGAQWIKGWFILKGTTFYGFKNREAHKADCFISLPGFTTSQAEEVKSRKFAFKVYHTGTVFYFAAESDEELAAWLDCLSFATHAIDVSTLKTSAAEGAVFSETEDEGDEEAEIADSCFPSPKMRKLTNFLSGHSSHSSNVVGAGGSPKPARSHQNLASSSDSKTYDIQKRFGSLKKLGYRSKYSNQLSSQSSSSATSLSSSDQSQEVPSAPHSLDRKVLRFLSSSKSQNVPVPTSQFKSYRRVVTTEHCPPFSKNSDGNSSRDETVVDPTSSQSVRSVTSPHGEQDVRRNNRSFGSRADDTPNTLTLEQFMLQRQEEDRQQNQHIHSQQQDRLREQERDPASPVHREASEGYTEDPVLSRHKSLEKRRTPPPAPPLLSPLPNQQLSVRPVPATRTILPAAGSNTHRDMNVEPPAIVPRTSKPSTDLTDLRDSAGVLKHSIGASADVLQRTPISHKQPRLKNAALYQPPPVAFPPSPSFGPSFEMHLDHRGSVANSPDEMWEGSRTKGASSKIRQLLSPKRGYQLPAHGQFTPHQSDMTIPVPQRTILGSPRLHRALFRQSDGRKQKNMTINDSAENSVYSPASYVPSGPSATSSPLSLSDWSSDLTPSPKPTMGVSMLGKKPGPTPPSFSNISNLSAMSPPLSPPQTPLSPPPDYPGLEYPPVFEPGIYSLSDSSTFLSQSQTPSLYSPSSDSSSTHQSYR
ncbi:uncharacterized protein LOC113217672 isoform X2 [Frankliniella occidentalis]|uniref:Uncharacterized protein LOC113217672 isoform X2 n=1 Tax=Frankliniella occidentalis TaxID=133901 RepID=A0A6J1TJH4_FRAOC|nr:uncharacterized protein LOC113217672 isoform X2 [Frankliniella occidentalis]